MAPPKKRDLRGQKKINVFFKPSSKGAAVAAAPSGLAAEAAEDLPYSPSATSEARSDEAVAPPRKKQATSKAKREFATTNAVTPYDTSAYQLAKIEVAQSSQTKALNDWRKLLAKGLRAKPNVVQEYTPTPGALKHILEFEVFNGRQFELLEDKVALFTVRRPHGAVKCWRLLVQDKSRSKAPKIDLFMLPKPTKSRKPTRFTYDDHAVDTNICPERIEAVRLGEIACRILNRIPAEDLEEGKWNQLRLNLNNKFRRFVETVALFTWNKDLDFRLLPENFSSLKSGVYLSATAIEDSRNSLGATTSGHLPGALVISQSGLCDSPHPANARHNVLLPADIDIAATESLPDVSDRFIFGGRYTGKLSIEERPALAAALNAHKVIRRELFGSCGTLRQFEDQIDDIRHGFVGKTYGQSSGIVNGYPLLYKPSIYEHGVRLRLSKAVRSLLEYKTDKGTSPIKTNDIQIYTATKDRLLLAYIYQQGVVTFAAGKGVMNALQAMAIAASLVDIGELRTDTVLQVYCTCSEAESKRFEHNCQHCFGLRLCCDLVIDEDGRRLCRHCAKSKVTTVFTPSVASLIHYSLRGIVYKEKDASPIDELAQQLSEYVIDKENWLDGYNGPESLSRSTYRDIALRASTSGGSRLLHPRYPSVDKVYGFFYDENGAVWRHHPENVILTKWVLNCLKGIHPPCLLPFFRQAIRVMKEIDTTERRLSDFQSFFEAFSAAADNSYMINRSIPYSGKDRLANRGGFTRKQFQNELRPQYTSGVWSGKGYGTHQSEFFTAATICTWELTKLQKNPGKGNLGVKPWSIAQRQVLKNLIDQIQASAQYNPRGLILPRGQDGSPWFFRASLQFRDLNWEWVFREFQTRLIRWYTECNKAHETKESTATLLIEATVQWFESGGGRCHLFGFQFTPFTRHAQNYSLGRAMTRLDSNGNRVEVQPGEIMRTGCTTLAPTDIYKDYDITRRTVVMESWSANRARSNFPVSTLDILKDAIATIAPETKWYEACKEKTAYRRVNFPRFWRPRNAKKNLLLPDEDDEDDDDEASMEEEVKEDDALADFVEDEIDGPYTKPLDPFDDISAEKDPAAEVKEGSEGQKEPEQSSDTGDESEEEGQSEGDPAELAIASEQGAKRFAPFVLQERTADMINLRAEDCVGPDSPLWGHFLQRVGTDGSSIDRAYPTWGGTFRLDENSTQAGNTVAWMREDGSIVDAEGGVIARFDPFAGSAGAKSSEAGTPGIEHKAVAVKDADEKAFADTEMTGVEPSNVGTQAGISLSTFAKLMHRRGMPSPLSNPADPDTPQADTVVSFGKWPDEELAFPNAEREYVTAGGRIVAVCNDEGQIIDREGNFLGQL